MDKSINSDDAEKLLISKAVNGDSRAVGALYDRYLNFVYNYVYYRIGNTRETQFVTEKIFAKVFNNLRQYDGFSKRSPFLAWLFKIASQEIKRYQKTNKFVNKFSAENYLDEQQEKLIGALRLLNEKDYQFVIARFLNGLNRQAVTDMLGVHSNKLNDVQLQALRAVEKILNSSR